MESDNTVVQLRRDKVKGLIVTDRGLVNPTKNYKADYGKPTNAKGEVRR